MPKPARLMTEENYLNDIDIYLSSFCVKGRYFSDRILTLRANFRYARRHFYSPGPRFDMREFLNSLEELENDLRNAARLMRKSELVYQMDSHLPRLLEHMRRLRLLIANESQLKPVLLTGWKNLIDEVHGSWDLVFLDRLNGATKKVGNFLLERPNFDSFQRLLEEIRPVIMECEELFEGYEVKYQRPKELYSFLETYSYWELDSHELIAN